MAKRSFYVKDSELDDYQVKVINKRTDNSFIVKGCAGSGKSVLALWKAKQIQTENKGSYLFIIFTNALVQYMADGIRQIGIDHKNIILYNKWKNQKCPGADYIIVDEAQDFSLEDIKLFQSKSEKALLLYGDSAQQLYTFRKDNPPASIEEIIFITKLPSEQLVFNHRLPKTIARVAAYISQVEDDLVGRCKNEGSEKPKILQYKNIEAQLDAIAGLIDNKFLKDVGILFRTNTDVEFAYNYLRDKHGMELEAKFSKFMNLDFASDNPKLLTYHSAKGLQFEDVFLPECTVEDKEQQSALYVALTRSYSSLYILHSGNLSSFFDEVPEHLYDTSLVGAKTERL